MPDFRAVSRHENLRFPLRTPCYARLSGAFDSIRGGLCPLELPLHCSSCYVSIQVFRQAEKRDTRPSSLLMSSGIAAQECIRILWVLAGAWSRGARTRDVLARFGRTASGAGSPSGLTGHHVSPGPQAGRLSVGRGRSPVIKFHCLLQIPVDRGAPLRYTGLAV